MRRRWRHGVAGAATVVAVSTLAATAAAFVLAPVRSTAAGVAAGGTAILVTETPAGGLHPGAAATATVVIQAAPGAALVVTSISGGASGAVGACPGGAVTSDPATDAAGVVQIDGVSRVVPGGGTARYVVTVRLDAAAPPGCAATGLSVPVSIDTSAVPG